MDPASARAVPTNGKVVVRLPTPSSAGGGGEPLLAEALLQLPDIPVKSLAGDKPPVVWVNIGLLAEDGLVLQLKLKRGDASQHERDKTSGSWYAYQPAGGALTVLRDRVLAPPAASAAAAGGEVLTPAVGLVGIQGTIGGAGTGKKPARGGAAAPPPKVQAVSEVQPRMQPGALQPPSAAAAQELGGVKPGGGTAARGGQELKAKIQEVQPAKADTLKAAEPVAAVAVGSADDETSQLELPD